MDWNYIWAAVAVNFLIVFIVPRLIKKPTGFQVLDDIVLYLNSQKSFFLASSIVIALTVYLAHKWVDGSNDTAPSSPEKY